MTTTRTKRGEEEKLEGLRDFAERQKQMEKRKEEWGSGERRNAAEKRKSETRGVVGPDWRREFFLLDLVHHLERTGLRYQVESQGRLGPSNSTHRETRTLGNLRTSTKTSRACLLPIIALAAYSQTSTFTTFLNNQLFG